MSNCERFTFESCTGQPLDARLWLPDTPPKAVLQLVHGMSEHIDRYERAALALTEAGYAVTGHTHLGHGPKAPLKGYFGPGNGWEHLIEDVHRLRTITQKRFEGLPYALMGHSMGSFVTRCYLMQHGEGLSAAILSGTGYYDPATVTAALTLSGMICVTGGAQKPSALIDKIGFATANKPFQPSRTPFDWLSRDEKEVDRYIADPHCGFIFTASGYRDLFRGLKMLTDTAALSRMPHDLPVLFFSGSEDPIGGLSAGVKKVKEQFDQAGMTDVTLRLYEGGRHEMLNETNRDEVVRDLIGWLNSHLPV